MTKIIESYRKLSKVIAWSMLLLMMAGCAGQKRVVVVHDTVENAVVLTQHQYHRDSVYVDRWHSVVERGDTVWRVDSVWVFRYLAVHDTVRDSVKSRVVEQVPVEVEKVVEKRVRGLFWWIGVVGVILCFGWLVARVWRLVIVVRSIDN